MLTTIIELLGVNYLHFYSDNAYYYSGFEVVDFNPLTRY